jgi:hypothetical protein
VTSTAGVAVISGAVALAADMASSSFRFLIGAPSRADSEALRRLGAAGSLP